MQCQANEAVTNKLKNPQTANVWRNSGGNCSDCCIERLLFGHLNTEIAWSHASEHKPMSSSTKLLSGTRDLTNKSQYR